LNEILFAALHYAMCPTQGQDREIDDVRNSCIVKSLSTIYSGSWQMTSDF